MVELVGVVHSKENLETCKRMIDSAFEKGLRIIGLERGLNQESVGYLQKRFGAKFPKYNWKRAAQSGFFNELNAYARAKKMTVVPIGSRFQSEYLHRLRMERTPAEKPLTTARWYRNLLVAGAMRNSASMASDIKRKSPELVFVGAAHAVQIASNLHIPIKQVSLVGATLNYALQTEKAAQRKVRQIKRSQKIKKRIKKLLESRKK